MANAFKNAGVAIGNSATTIYQTPIGVNSSVVHSIYIANVDGVNSATVNIEVSTDGAGSGKLFPCSENSSSSCGLNTDT